jgi:hypothetical protein
LLYRSKRLSRATEVSDKNPLWDTTLIHDRKNNQEDGIHGPKRIKTIDQRDCTCSFKFMVKWQIQVGFFIELEKYARESFHCFHPKVLDTSTIPFPSQLLTSEQIENTLHVVNATASLGAGCNFLHLSIEKFISLVKISYLSQKASGKNQSHNNDIECMINNFRESNEISFISFSDVPVQGYLDGTNVDSSNDAIQSIIASKDTVTISTCKVSSSNIKFREISDINLKNSRVSEEREERKLNKKDGLFIAVTWILKPAFCFFMLCLEVVFLDVTSYSNNKGYHLLTFSSRTSIGKQVVWMWIFIPNQQIFSF